MNIKNNNMVIRKSGVDYVTVTGFMYKDAVGVAIKLAKNAGIDCYQAAVMEGIFSEIDEDTKYDMVDTIAEKSISNGHKMGGYPHFTQEDPRADSHEILLLQIDTDHPFGIMWGDSGISNFFISADDLANADFSNVLYNWDCL